MKVHVHASLDEIPAGDWNRLAGDNPFLRHEFLAALEHSGCVSEAHGWRPRHLSCRAPDGSLLGALPLYLKSHSYGEFVFDWAWAEAYQRAGRAYYPKLVSAIPYSPVPGPRLLTAAGTERDAVASVLIAHTRALAAEHHASSIHCLFPEEEELPAWEAHGFLPRRDCQFHWHNRGYADFDAFLATFTAEKRKKVRRERRRIVEAGIEIRALTGNELDAKLMDALYRFYAATYAKRMRSAYLNRAFFDELRERMPDSFLAFVAFLDGKPVAAAICLRNAHTLYGRHWGNEQDFHSLHFETCYYRGIDYCIEHGLQRFNPGTQGEHKLARGFEPTYTWSSHWLAMPQFHHAVDEFLRREQHVVSEYFHETEAHLPFHAADRHER